MSISDRLKILHVLAMGAYLPPALALHHRNGHLEEAVGAVPAHDLLYYTTRTSYLLAFFTVQEMLWGVQGEIGAR